MSAITYRAEAVGPLRKVEWTIPDGVSAIVGPNRVGKSSLLRLPEFLRVAVMSGLVEAVRDVLRGPALLRNFTVPPTTVCRVGLDFHDVAWSLELTPSGASVVANPAETLAFKENVLVSRPAGVTRVQVDGTMISVGSALVPQHFVKEVVATEDARKISIEMAETLNTGRIEGLGRAAAGAVGMSAAHTASYRTYDYQVTHLLRFGSTQSSHSALLSTGENVFPLLRNWRDQSENEARFEFVLSTLREAFPHVHKLDFETAGQTVTVSVVDRRWKNKTPIAFESTGLMMAILQLCAVASGGPSGLVTIDELETSLHPHAIKVLVAAFRRWAEQHDMRIVLATQSETVLDQFRDAPENIFVMEGKQEVSPRRLTELFGADWLSQFSLGDLFAHLEFGAPDLPPQE